MTRTGGAVAVLVACALWITGACGDSSPEDKVADDLSEGLKAQLAGDNTKAAESYRKVLERDSNNKFAHYNLGLLAQLANDTATAETQYRAALAADPDFPSALFNLAIVLTPTKPHEALELYRHLLRVDPNNAGGHLNLGFLLISMGQHAEGNAELDRAVELDPASASRIPSTTTTTPDRAGG